MGFDFEVEHEFLRVLRITVRGGNISRKPSYD